MQITLNQDEIEVAIKNFVGQQGISIIGKRTEVTLIAGRAPNGMSASINISDDEPQHGNVVGHRKPTTFGDQVRGTVVEVSEPEDAIASEPEEVTAQRPLFGN